jgi:hypothetical protein
VVNDQYLAFNAADMSAFDALPAEVRAAMRKSLVVPPAQLMAQWILQWGVRGALAALAAASRICHQEAVAKGEVCPVRPGDSLSL